MTHPAAGAPRPRPPDRDPTRCSPASRPSRRVAVRHGPGPLLIVAGPGTGKTRTLTHRVAHLLATGQAAPREILAVTFSVRAAGELRLRLTDLLGEQARARRDRRHLPLRVRAAAARARRPVRAHRRLHDLRPGRPAPRDRMAARRPPARPRSSRRSRAAGSRPRPSSRPQIALAKSRLHTPDSYRSAAPRTRPASSSPPLWRAVEDELRALQRLGLRRPARVRGAAAAPSTRSGSRTCARAGAGWSSTRCRTPTTRRPRSCTSSPARTAT